MPESIPFRQSLLRNLVPLVLLVGVAAMTITFIGARLAARDLASTLVVADTERFSYQLRLFFEPVEKGLRLAQQWHADELVSLDDAADLDRLFVPLLQAYPSRASSFLLADDTGREYMLLRIGNGWRTRRTDATQDPGHATITSWEDALAGERITRTESRTAIDYDPRTRPWYTGAIAKLAATEGAVVGPVHWTDPYIFFTTGQPGITASIAFRTSEGRTLVAGLDVLLEDITNFTRQYVVGKTGGAIVLSADRRVVGLPHSAWFQTEEEIRGALLKHQSEIDWPLAKDVLAAARARTDRPLFRFHSQGEPYWASATSLTLGQDRAFFIGVLVPEADLVGDLFSRQAAIALATLAFVGLAVVRAVYMARRYSRPVERLVAQSDRVAAGDLEPSEPVASRIAEVRALAAAQERLRIAVRALLKVEGDLKVARRIQQSMLPASIPEVPGYSIAGWGEPADQTGGDIYDVVGFTTDDHGRRPQPDGVVQGAMLLLADATGHGIGPALMATQVRSMFRMAIQGRETLSETITRMNAQLCLDLTDGRFVTAWLAAIGAADAPVQVIAAGHGPTLILRNNGTLERFDADAPPMGVMSDLPEVEPNTVHLGPGEVLMAVSDGIYECFSPEGKQWGLAALRETVLAARHQSAAGIVAAIRQGVAAHARGRPADDDRTVIVIKREAGPS